ncbi:MAG: hypothetical protein AAF492_17110, partial [Verrucomicrobiota bacterium]
DDRILRELADAVFPEPDLTVYLSLTPDLAIERKTESMLSQYETGCAESPDRAAFLAFQEGCHRELEAVAEEKSWRRIDASQSIQQITDRIFSVINE